MYEDVMDTFLGLRSAGAGIADGDDGVRSASRSAFLMAVMRGDAAMVDKAAQVFLEPNIVTQGAASRVATVRRKVEIEAEEILRHVANENDPELVAQLLKSVATDPVDHARNELVVRMMRQRTTSEDALNIITRGSPVVVEAALAQMPSILEHPDEQVRKCGVRILAAAVDEGDAETAVRLAQWLEPAPGPAAAKVRKACAAALRAVAGGNSLAAETRLKNLAADEDWSKRLSAVRALTLIADKNDASDLCEFFSKMVAHEESNVVRWVCLKAIRALSNSAISASIVLENYDEERAELLRLLQNVECPHGQRVEAVRMLGDMVRGNDAKVVAVLSESACNETHPIMRALAIKSLREIVLSWDAALIQAILPCLLDLEAVVRRAAVEALFLKVTPGDREVVVTCLRYVHTPVVAPDDESAASAINMMSSMRQRGIRQAVLQVLRRVIRVGDEDTQAMLVEMLLEENRKSLLAEDPEDSSSQSMDLYTALVEALGFVVAGAQRGLVSILKAELKLARAVQAAREAMRPGSRGGRSSRAADASSRASSRLDKDLMLLEDLREDCEDGEQEQECHGRACQAAADDDLAADASVSADEEEDGQEGQADGVDDGKSEVDRIFDSMDLDRSGSISRDELLESLRRFGYSAKRASKIFQSFDGDGSQQISRREFAKALERMHAEDIFIMEADRLLPGVSALWVSRYLRVAMRILAAQHLNTDKEARPPADSRGGARARTAPPTDVLHEKSRDSRGLTAPSRALSQGSSAGGGQVGAGASQGGRTAPSTGEESRRSRVSRVSGRTAKSSSSGMSTNSPEFLALVDMASFSIFAGLTRGGGGGAGAKDRSRPESRASESSSKSGLTSASRGKPPSEVNLTEASLTLADLQLLLASKQMMPAVFPRALVVKTWQNLIAQRAPKIVALKRQLRRTQGEESNTLARVQQLKNALRVAGRLKLCVKQLVQMHATTGEIWSKVADAEEEFTERLQEHMHELKAHTWAILARPLQSEMAKLVWVEGELKLQDAEEAAAAAGAVAADSDEQPLTKIGAQFSYEQAVAKVAKLEQELSADTKLVNKSRAIAKLVEQERKIKTRSEAVAARIGRLEKRLMRVAMRNQRLSDALDAAEVDAAPPDRDIFVVLDRLGKEGLMHLGCMCPPFFDSCMFAEHETKRASAGRSAAEHGHAKKGKAVAVDDDADFAPPEEVALGELCCCLSLSLSLSRLFVSSKSAATIIRVPASLTFSIRERETP